MGSVSESDALGICTNEGPERRKVVSSKPSGLGDGDLPLNAKLLSIGAAPNNIPRCRSAGAPMNPWYWGLARWPPDER